MIKNKIIFIVPNEENNSRLDRCLRRNLGSINQSVLEKSLRDKLILLNGKKAKSSKKVLVGQQITYDEALFSKKNKEYFFDKNIENKFYIDLFKKILIKETVKWLVLNKPNKIAVQGGTKQKIFIDKLLKIVSNKNFKLVHRLDKETSGILMIAKNLKSAQEINEFFKQKKIFKLYVAIITPPPKKNSGMIETKIDKENSENYRKMYNSDNKGKLAKTFYKIYKKKNNFALVGLHPLTGRTHQLRVHMNYIGCSIVGDTKYDIYNSNDNSKELLKLHAFMMKLPNEELIEANLPEHFKNFLNNKNIKIEINLIKKDFLKRKSYE